MDEVREKAISIANEKIACLVENILNSNEDSGSENVTHIFDTYEAALWQPIETAPKGGRVMIHMFNGNITAIDLAAAKDRSAITHWRPLPTPPETKGG